MVSSLISSVQGPIESVGPDTVNIRVGGISLQVNVPSSTAQDLGGVGDHARLYTCLQVREDNLTLYGFTSEDARAAFEALVAVSGVGPRVALNVLSAMTPGALAVAVGSADTDAFVAVPGVGKKTAGRIILDLRGKLAEDLLIQASGADDSDALDALTALGYSIAEARTALASLGPAGSTSAEERVREALLRIASG